MEGYFNDKPTFQPFVGMSTRAERRPGGNARNNKPWGPTFSPPPDEETIKVGVLLDRFSLGDSDDEQEIQPVEANPFVRPALPKLRTTVPLSSSPIQESPLAENEGRGSAFNSRFHGRFNGRFNGGSRQRSTGNNRASCSPRSPSVRQAPSFAPQGTGRRLSRGRAIAQSESPRAAEAVLSVYDNALFGAEESDNEDGSPRLTERRLAPTGFIRAASEPPKTAAKSLFGRSSNMPLRDRFEEEETDFCSDESVDFRTNQFLGNPRRSNSGNLSDRTRNLSRRQPSSVEPAPQSSRGREPVFRGSAEPRRRSRARARRSRVQNASKVAKPGLSLLDDTSKLVAIGFFAGVAFRSGFDHRSRAASEPPPDMLFGPPAQQRYEPGPSCFEQEGVGRYGGRWGESGNIRSTSSLRPVVNSGGGARASSVEAYALVERGLRRASRLVPGSRPTDNGNPMY